MNKRLRDAIAKTFSALPRGEDGDKRVPAYPCVSIVDAGKDGMWLTDAVGDQPPEIRHKWANLLNATEVYDEDRPWMVRICWYVENDIDSPGPMEWNTDSIVWGVGPLQAMNTAREVVLLDHPGYSPLMCVRLADFPKPSLPSEANNFYVGTMDEQGNYHVSKNGRTLSAVRSRVVRNHSPAGFAWGYNGSGPAQLALALLLEETNSIERATRYYQQFKQEVVSEWVNTRFEIQGRDILGWLDLIEEGEASS